MAEKKQNKNELVFNKGAIISEPGSTEKYKTGEWRTFKPSIDQEKCIKCGKCWSNCPDAAIHKDENGNFQINYDYCKGCLICEKECPVKCISHETEEK
jgi:pyruvate ferredoxin oxidoreductase delta subunit